MSVWDRIGHLASNVADFGKDAVTAAWAAPKFIWDVATAPWNDDEQFNGFTRTVKSAAANAARQAAPLMEDVVGGLQNVTEAPGIKPALQTIDRINREYVREPLAAGLLTISGKADGMDQAREMAQDVSFGQALVGAVGAVTPGEQAVDKLDYNNPEAVKKFFSEGAARTWSGVGDMGIQVFGDLTIVGGKAVKGVRASQYISDSYRGLYGAERRMKDINEIVDATSGVVNKWTPVIEKFRDNGAMYAYHHPTIRNSDARDVLAYGLGQAKSNEEVGLLLRAARGDTRALDEIKVKQADLGNAIDKQQGVLDSYQKMLLDMEAIKTGAIQDIDVADPAKAFQSKQTFMEAVAKLPHEDQAVVKDVMDELGQLREKNARFLQWEEMANTPGGVVSRGTGVGAARGFDTFLAQARSQKYRNVTVDTWQPTPFHRMYQVVRWAGEERPAGIVNLNDETSSAEVIAFVNRGVKLGAVDESMAEKLMTGYMRSNSPEDRAISLQVIENAVTKGLFAKHSVAEEDALAFYQAHWKARSTAIDSLKKVGFMVDKDGAVVRYPQLESQTANYLPMIDIDLMHSILRQVDIAKKSETAAWAYAGAKGAINILDTLQTMFKAAVLMRLGYTVRNGAEAQMRIMASTGALTSARFFGEGMRNMLFNTGDRAASLVGRVAKSHGEMSYIDTKNALQKADGEVSDIIDKLNAAQARYDASVAAHHAPGPVPAPFKSNVFTDEELAKLEASDWSEGSLPARHVEDSQEYKDQVRQVTKWAQESYERDVLGDPMHQQRVEAVASAFNLSGTDLRRFERTGLLPVKNVVDAFGYGKGPKTSNLSTDELSAILSTGRIEAADYAIGEGGAFQRVDFGDYRYYASAEELPIDFLATSTKAKPRRFVRAGFGPSHTPEEWLQENLDMMHEGFVSDRYAKLIDEYNAEVSVYNDKFEAMTAGYVPAPIDTDALAEVNALNDQFNELLAVRNAYQEQMTAKEAAVSKRGKRKMGNGTLVVKLANGSVYEHDAAFGGKLADIHRRNSSSQESFNRMVDSYSSLNAKNQVTKGYGAVNPEDSNYYTAWARTLNHMFGNSQVAMKLIGGEDPADVAKWLKRNPAGVEVARRMGIDPLEIDEYVARIDGFVAVHVPDPSIASRMARGEQITPENLREVTVGRTDLPIINGHILGENFNLLSTKTFKNLVNSAYRLIGSMPEDAAARHPLYAKFFAEDIKRRVLSWEKQHPGEIMTAEQSRLMDRAAHASSLRELKRTLFTIDRRSNAAHLMRFIAPFFSAFENTAKTWARISYENPQTINRLNLIFTAPNRAGIATDENGNPVPVDQASMNDYIWLQVPQSLKNVPWIGKGLQSLDNLGVQKRSLDVMFQGDPIQVPVGPYVAMPVSWVVSKRPDLEKSMQWAIPYGPDRNAIMSLMPAWVKRQITKSGGMDDQQYANTYSLIWMTEQHKRRDKGMPPATESEIRQMTDAYWNMRTVANLVLPFAPTFQSPYKFYIDKFREYQKAYGLNAKEQFWKDYGDEFFQFTSSLSKNPTGTFASVGSVENAKAHPQLVADLAAIDPSLVSLVTNAGVEYSYSNAAYLWQQRNTLSPSTSETFRTKQDPRAAEAQNQRDLGWIKYRQVVSGIDAIMKQRGLTSLNQKKAADLAMLKKAAIQKIGLENEAWYNDYLDTDGSKTNKVIAGLERIMSDKKFMDKFGNNQTFKAVAVYLNVRGSIEQSLAARPTRGINAKANADLKLILDSVVSDLKSSDPGFGDLYDRWLSYDPVYDLIHSTKVGQ